MTPHVPGSLTLLLFLHPTDDISFAIVIELKDDKAPTVTHGKEPPPWVPATVQHTTTGASEDAQLHMLRAVDTGIINVRSGSYSHSNTRYVY